MFDIDNFVSDYTAALGESETWRAIREVLARALAGHSAVANTLIIHLPG